MKAPKRRVEPGYVRSSWSRSVRMVRHSFDSNYSELYMAISDCFLHNRVHLVLWRYCSLGIAHIVDFQALFFVPCIESLWRRIFPKGFALSSAIISYHRPTYSSMIAMQLCLDFDKMFGKMVMLRQRRFDFPVAGQCKRRHCVLQLLFSIIRKSSSQLFRRYQRNQILISI